MSADPSQKTQIICPQCGKHLMVPNAALGKSGKCPGCQHVFPLQAPTRAASPPVVRQPAAATADPFGGANADPLADSSGFDQAAQPMGPSPLGAPQGQFGAPQQFGQQPAGGYAPSPAFQQPNPGQWSSSGHPYGSPSVTQQAKKRKKSESGDATPMGQIGGGLLMMIGAVVWFVLGLMGGVLLIYPPILFVLGLVSLIAGIAGLGK